MDDKRSNQIFPFTTSVHFKLEWVQIHVRTKWNEIFPFTTMMYISNLHLNEFKFAVTFDSHASQNQSDKSFEKHKLVCLISNVFGPSS